MRVRLTIAGSSPLRLLAGLGVPAAALLGLAFSFPSAAEIPAPAPIVFTQVDLIQTLAADSVPRSRIVRLDPGGKPRALATELYASSDPEISFDGKHILFAGRTGPRERWQIYEMNADGSGVRRITNEPMDCRSPIYQSYFYVITSDVPWHQIAFTGSADGLPPSLYSTKLDGSGLRRLTFNPYGDRDPFLMPDGRIVFSSSQRNRLERGPKNRDALFGVNLDGTDYAVFSAGEGAPWKRMPTVTTDREVIFVENEQPAADGSGWLASVTMRRNLHSYRRLTQPDEGLFLSPSPLHNGEVLVARRPADGSGTYALVRYNPATGALSEVFDDPGYQDIEPRELAPRPEPDGRSSVVNEQDPTGLLYCLNVFETDVASARWGRPGVRRRLRVVEGLPRVKAEASTAPPPARRILGEIAVEPDGSFNVRVPANIPIQLQLLDEHGLAMRTCSWIWVKNREPRGCIGCHEDGELTPTNRMVDAVRKPSIALTLPPERRRRVTFERNILPIITAKCATPACHGGTLPQRLRDHAQLRRYVAGTARTSPLVWHLTGRMTAQPWDDLTAAAVMREKMPPAGMTPLTDDELRTIFEWIDMGAE